MMFIFIGPRLYVLGSLLAIIGVTCLGSSFVLLNAFLPLLVSNNPSTNEPGKRVNGANQAMPVLRDLTDSRRNSNPSTSRSVRGVDQTDLQLSTRISSKGVGLGYCAAVSVQCLSIIILYSLGKTSLSDLSPSIPVRIVLFAVGLCWSVGTIPAVVWLRDRPGPPLEPKLRTSTGVIGACVSHFTFAWISLWRTIRTAAQLREARIFLVAWFLMSDAIATVSGTAILFARTELNMGTVEVAILSITATSSGIAGAFAWPRISKAYSLSTNSTIIACILLMEVIPIYGLIGYLPFIQSWGVGGLQKSWEL